MIGNPGFIYKSDKKGLIKKITNLFEEGRTEMAGKKMPEWKQGSLFGMKERMWLPVSPVLSPNRIYLLNIERLRARLDQAQMASPPGAPAWPQYLFFRDGKLGVRGIWDRVIGVLKSRGRVNLFRGNRPSVPQQRQTYSSLFEKTLHLQ